MSNDDFDPGKVSRRTYLQAMGAAGLATVTGTGAAALGDGDVQAVGSGNYATVRPGGVHETPGESLLFATDDVAPPYPTNGWWQRELFGVASEESIEPYAYGFGLINAVPAMAVSKEAGDGFRLFYGTGWGGDPATSGNVSVDYDGSPGLDVGHAATDQVDATRLAGYGDWHTVVEYGSGTASLTATFTKGSAFTFCEYEGGEAELALVDADDAVVGTDSASVWYDGGNVLGVTVTASGETKHYGLFAPEGVSFDGVADDGTLASNPITTSGLVDNGGYLTVAVMPDTDASTIQEFERYAYNVVRDTTVDWEYVQTDDAGNPVSEVRTTFSFDLEQKPESTDSGTLAWLFPHQYKHTDAALREYDLFSAKGTLKLWAGSSFHTTKTYRGILPMLPGSVLDSEAATNVQSAVDQLIDDTSTGGTGPYSEWEVPAATYWVGKTLFRNTVAAPVAEQHASAGKDASVFLDAVQARLESWFDATSDEFTFDGTTYTTTNENGESRELFYYDTDLGTLIGYPSGEFFLSRQMNDHHFHYGYFVYAASEVARQNPAWAEEYGDMVELLVRDYANWERPTNDGDPTTATSAIDETTPRDSPKDAFPFLRNFDAWAGHSWAGGLGSWNGNNQESSSEAVNAYAAMIRWGEITGNTELRDAGIFLYTQEVYAIWEYWFDAAADSHPDGWGTDVDDDAYAPTGSQFEYATKVRGIGFDRDLWWTPQDPIEHYGINWIPTGGHSFYLGRDPAYANANWQALLDARERYSDIADPERDFMDGWKAAAWSYRALSNPGDAVDIADAAMSSGPVLKDGGNSGPVGYQFAHALDAMGTPDEVTADTPFYQVFADGEQRTYVAYNAGDTATVTFSDGFSMDVPAGTTAVESSAAHYSPDGTPPADPANLSVDGTTYDTVDLSWDPVTDDESGLLYYGVYVDGQKVREAAEPQTTVTGLDPGTEYTVSVSAVDVAGNESGQASATATTDSADTAVPDAPSGLFAIEWDADSVELGWTSQEDIDFGVDHYRVYVDGQKQAEATSPPTTVTGLSGGEVEVTVTVVNGDPAGNESDDSDPITVTLEDPSATNEPYFGTPQPLPGRLEVEYYDRGGPNVAYRDTTAGQETNSQFRADQNVAIGSDAPTGYNIAYTAQYEWLEYTVTVDSAGTYDVVGSYANNTGAPGGPIRVEIDGDAVGDSLDVPANGSWTSFEQGTLGTVDLPEGTHVVRLYLEGGGFNLDWLEFRESGSDGDATAPTAPTNLSASTTADSASLSWDAATDAESSVARYEVYRDGSPVATVGETTATIEGLTGGTEFEFGVAAVDAFGNVSEQATVTATTDMPDEDTTKPEAPPNLRAVNRTKTSVDLSWDDATDNVGVDAYCIYLDGAKVAETDHTWITLDDLSPATTYEVGVDAVDAAGNVSEITTLAVTTADRTGQAPLTAPHELPGTIRAEEFDTGGQGVAYHDTTPGNQVNIEHDGGIEYRNDTDVDVGALEGDYNVGFIAEGEWLEYTIEVPATGYYDVSFDVAAGEGGGGSFHLEIDGVDVTGSVSVAQTGGWTVYERQGPIEKVPLTKGTHVLRFQSGGGFNLDEFVISPSTGPAIDRSDWSVTPMAAYHDAGGRRAIDGDPETEWASHIPFHETAITYAVDMGAEHEIASVSVNHLDEGSTPAAFDVQVSGDGESWNTVATVDSAVTTVVEFEPVSTRYFRLVDRDEEGTGWWKITELQAFEAAGDLTSDDEAPGAPANLTVETDVGTRVKLSWDPSGAADLAHYAVYRDGTLVRRVASAEAVVGDLTPDLSYEFAVTAVDAAGNESAAATTSVAPDGHVAYAASATEVGPSTLRVDFVPDASVELPFISYKVNDGERTFLPMMRADDGSLYAVIGSLSPGDTVAYTLYYTRAGYARITDSTQTEFASERTAGVTGLTVENTTQSSIRLSWNVAGLDDAAKFSIRDTEGVVTEVTADATTVELADLDPSTWYGFTVVAHRQDGSTLASNVVLTWTEEYSLPQARAIAGAWRSGGDPDAPLPDDGLDYATVREAAADAGGSQ